MAHASSCGRSVLVRAVFTAVPRPKKRLTILLTLHPSPTVMVMVPVLVAAKLELPLLTLILKCVEPLTHSEPLWPGTARGEVILKCGMMMTRVFLYSPEAPCRRNLPK